MFRYSFGQVFLFLVLLIQSR